MSVLLDVEGLAIELQTTRGAVRVVDDVSFRITRGHSVALVGESGSGKSLTAFALMGLLPDAAHVVGGHADLHVDGAVHRLTSLHGEALRRLRGNRVAMVFQDPQSAFNPVLRVGTQVAEPLVVHGRMDRRAARMRAIELLERCGVPEPALRARAYPHELSGGLRQRALIAMALACEPDLLIADEPTTALDVTVQAQVLALLRDLQRERGLGLLLITHDLGVVAAACDDVHVMYGGRVVESAPVRAFFAQPLHPYGAGLLAAMPARAARGRPLTTLRGVVPALHAFPSGCRFRDRCDDADGACANEPVVVTRADGHRVRCQHPRGVA